MKKIHIEFSEYLEKAVLLKKSTVLQFQKIICRNR